MINQKLATTFFNYLYNHKSSLLYAIKKYISNSCSQYNPIDMAAAGISLGIILQLKLLLITNNWYINYNITNNI